LGRIEFVAGQIVHATAGAATGTKALFRMLGWTAARFRVLSRPAPPTETTISAATSNVLMDGLVSLDEWGRWRPPLPPGAARLELSAEARSRLHGHTVTPAEFDVLARARGGVSVDDAVEASPHPDAMVAEAICTLLTRGIVRAQADLGAGAA